MRRRTLRGGAAVLALLAAVGAGAAGGRAHAASPKPATKASGFPLTLTDDAGKRLTFTAAPARIVCLSPAHTETLYALGAQPHVVGEDQYSDYPPQAKALAKINCFPRVPLEPVVALKPDLVIVMVQGADETRGMEAAGLRVIKLFPKTFAESLRGIETLGRITGTAARAKQIVTAMEARRKAVVERVKGAPRKRVMYELDALMPQRPYVAGGGGFYGELIGLAGGDNIFSDERSPAFQTGLEQVVARDPEVILLGDSQSPVQPQSPESVAARPGWSGLTAVKHRQIYPVISDRITRPSPRLADGLEELARRLHPDRFK